MSIEQSNADYVLESKVFAKADTARRLLRRQLSGKMKALERTETEARRIKAELTKLVSLSAIG